MLKEYNNKGKRYIQNLIFSNINIVSSALVLGGPNFKEYISFINEKVTKNEDCKIDSYEIDNNSLNNQIQHYRNFNKKLAEKVRINFGNIKLAKAERFIDLDLMGNICTQNHIIKRLFNKQNKIQTDYNKVFMFTVSMRQSTLQDTLDFIKKLLSLKDLIIINKTSLKYGFEYKLNYKNSKYKINLYTYRDGCPMINCCIYY